MDVSDLLNSLINNSDALKKLGSKVGVDENKVQDLAKLGLPAILTSITRNASTEEGALSLFNALEQHQDDDIDDLDRFLENSDSKDGEKILKHVFTSKNEDIQKKLAKQTGLDFSQVTGILSTLAPVVLGFLGQQKKKQNLDSAGVSDFTQTITSSLNQPGTGGMMGIVTQLLDSDKDGNVIDDIGNILGSFFNKK